MNKVILSLTFGKDPEITYTGNQKAIARFSGAVRRDYKDADGNYGTDWINFVAFDKTAEFIEKYFKKGSKALVEGKIVTGSYTNKNGQKVYTTDVQVEKIEFSGSKADNADTRPAPAPADTFMNLADIDESLPFM